MTTSNYSNRDIDAKLMHQRLAWGRDITTQQARERLKSLAQQRSSAIANYKNSSGVEREIGTLEQLLQDRACWSSYCCDDCSHWVVHV